MNKLFQFYTILIQQVVQSMLGSDFPRCWKHKYYRMACKDVSVNQRIICLLWWKYAESIKYFDKTKARGQIYLEFDIV